MRRGYFTERIVLGAMLLVSTLVFLACLGLILFTDSSSPF